MLSCKTEIESFSKSLPYFRSCATHVHVLHCISIVDFGRGVLGRGEKIPTPPPLQKKKRTQPGYKRKSCLHHDCTWPKREWKGKKIMRQAEQPKWGKLRSGCKKSATTTKKKASRADDTLVLSPYQLLSGEKSRAQNLSYVSSQAPDIQSHTVFVISLSSALSSPFPSGCLPPVALACCNFVLCHVSFSKMLLFSFPVPIIHMSLFIFVGGWHWTYLLKSEITHVEVLMWAFQFFEEVQRVFVFVSMNLAHFWSPFQFPEMDVTKLEQSCEAYRRNTDDVTAEIIDGKFSVGLRLQSLFKGRCDIADNTHNVILRCLYKPHLPLQFIIAFKSGDVSCTCTCSIQAKVLGFVCQRCFPHKCMLSVVLSTTSLLLFFSPSELREKKSVYTSQGHCSSAWPGKRLSYKIAVDHADKFHVYCFTVFDLRFISSIS